MPFVRFLACFFSGTLITDVYSSNNKTKKNPKDCSRFRIIIVEFQVDMYLSVWFFSLHHLQHSRRTVKFFILNNTCAEWIFSLHWTLIGKFLLCGTRHSSGYLSRRKSCFSPATLKSEWHIAASRFCARIKVFFNGFALVLQLEHCCIRICNWVCSSQAVLLFTIPWRWIKQSFCYSRTKKKITDPFLKRDKLFWFCRFSSLNHSIFLPLPATWPLRRTS